MCQEEEDKKIDPNNSQRHSPGSSEFMPQSKGTGSGSSGSGRQPHVSLYQKAVRLTIIDDISRNKSFHMNNIVSESRLSGKNVEQNRMSQTMPEESKGESYGSQLNMQGAASFFESKR